MKFENEEDFRQWLVSQISVLVGEKWSILHGKNVSDVVLCKNDKIQPLILFVEVKYHKSTHGRIGFGNGSGKGYQPEILLKEPLYLEKYMRWVIADDNSERCLLFTNNDVRNNCAGRIEEGKQNNFTNRLFDQNKAFSFAISDAPLHIAEWVRQQ
jgi:hypothetical protein